MPMAAAQHGLVNGLLPALQQQAAMQRAIASGDVQKNDIAGQRARYSKNAALALPEARNRAGETLEEWRRRCAERQALAEVSGYPISDIEQRAIDAEHHEWEQINGR